MRRFRLIAVLTCVTVVVACVAGTMLDRASTDRIERYHQHEQAQQLADLPEADRQAASSTSIDPATFASHLPVVSIDTHGQEIPGAPVRDENDAAVKDEQGRVVYTMAPDGSDSVRVSLQAFDQQGQANRLDDSPTLESDCLIRLRGNSSRFFDKPNYKITLVKDDGSDNDAEFLGMDQCETWVLTGPSLDRTLLRNYLTYNIAGEFMNDFVPDVRFCEVFVNGAYQGVYVATESIKVEKGRLEMNESDPRSAVTSYLVTINDSHSEQEVISEFLSYTLRIPKNMTVEYPGLDVMTSDQHAWIERDLSGFEKALYSYDYDTSAYGYAHYIDVDSFVDVFITNEFAGNDDFAGRSTYLYKDVRGKVTLGPIWDYNNCYDNYEEAMRIDQFYTVERAWYFMLFKDEAFCERVIRRYEDLRQGALSEGRLMAFIDGAIAYLGPAIERNNAVWGYLYDVENVHASMRLKPLERNPRSYEEAIGQLKGYIRERGAWLDHYIYNLRQYSHESAVKKYNH